MTRARPLLAAAIIALLTIPAIADQTPQVGRMMRAKLTRSQAILGAVVTSDWATLDRESRALAQITHDPAWLVMTAPEYLKQSDAFINALQQLIEASAKKDLDLAADADVALTISCVRCHVQVSRNRLGR